MQLDTIIFDLGGVLVDWDPLHVYKRVFKDDPKKLDFFLQEVCNHDWNIEQDAGRRIGDAIKIKVLEFPEFEKEINLYYDQWHLMFSGVFEDNVALLKRLQSNGYKVYALTNWSAETWPRALELFPFFKDFDGVIVSGIEKTRKPFKPIYRLIVERYQLKVQNTVFIDDKLENVLTSRDLGFHGIHFTADMDLAKTLTALGLETS